MLWALLLVGCGPLVVEEPTAVGHRLDMRCDGGAGGGICIEATASIRANAPGDVRPLWPLRSDDLMALGTGVHIGAREIDPVPVEPGDLVAVPYAVCAVCESGDPAPTVGDYYGTASWVLADHPGPAATLRVLLVME